MLNKINFDRRYLDRPFIDHLEDKDNIKNKVVDLNDKIDSILSSLENKKDSELESFADFSISLFLQSYCTMYGMNVKKTKKDYIVHFDYNNDDIANGKILDPRYMRDMSNNTFNKVMNKLDAYINKHYKKNSMRAKESKKFLRKFQHTNEMFLNGIVDKKDMKFSKKEFAQIFAFCNLV